MINFFDSENNTFMKENVFEPLFNLSPLTCDYYQDALTCTYEEPNIYHNRCYYISKRFSESKICYDLTKKFGKLDGKILKTSPCHGYDWHSDPHRQLGLNFLLGPSDQNYLTLFRIKTPYTPKDNLNFKLFQFIYTPYIPTLFNSKIEHSVLNLDKINCRFLLTVDFNLKTNYSEVKTFLENYNEQGDIW